MNVKPEQLEKLRGIVSDSWENVPKNNVGLMAYAPSAHNGGESFDQLVELMDLVVTKHIMSKTPKFLDLGFGDGLVCFLAHYFGFDSYGLDINREMLKHAEGYKEQLGLVDKPKFIAGNFADRDTYPKLGLGVSDIDFFYIYPSCEALQPALDMVARKAKSGAVIAVKYSGENNKSRLPNNLVPQESLKMKENVIGLIDIFKVNRYLC